jgi:predicted metalloprotease with PDZ domain
VRYLRNFQPPLLYVAVLYLAGGTPSLLASTPVNCAAPVRAQPQATEYFVSLADNASRVAHISIRFPETNGPLILKMPVWNALYQVRDFAVNIENVRATNRNGQPITVLNSSLSEWQVPTPTSCVVVQYDIHLDNPGPFGAQLNQEHAFFNWAMVLMYSPSTRSQSMSVQVLDVPSTWGMHDLRVLGSAAPGGVEKVIGVARNYDDLVDSPVEIGSFQQFDFQQDGATYHIVVHASPSDYDSSKLEEALRRITHAAVDWMADRPFTEYTYIYHFPHGHGAGGMEHAYGSAIDLDAERLKSNLMPVASVSSHEFFHLWNVKRIRPQSLEPVDYQRAMDTRALWFSEGVTSTVGDMLLARAGLSSNRQYVDRVASEINELQSRPAHHWQSVEDSSLDAWFEDNTYYRSPRRSISYYNKGEVLGVLLDLRIRQLTNGRKSLRDLFQWMNEEYAKKGLNFPDSDGVQHAAEAVAGQSFAEFFHDYVAGVRELPYDDFFGFVGLQLAETTSSTPSAGFETASFLDSPPEVTSVVSGSEAERAGIAVGDRIVEINGRPARGQVEQQISRLRPGATLKIRVANRSGQRDIKLKLTTRSAQVYILQDMASVTPEQRARREAWIRGDDVPGGQP